jgi:predicted DNA-binding transcriptional regulator AlpA
MNEGKLLNINEASNYLGIKEYAFKNAYYNIYNQKSPKAVRIGKRIYFTRESLNDFVKNNEIIND